MDVLSAVINGELKKVKEALKNKADDINKKDLFGKTALHIAVAKSDNLEIIEELLTNGADVNAVDQYGRTALHAFVTTENNNLKILQKLLDAEVDVFVKDAYDKKAQDLTEDNGVKETLKKHIKNINQIAGKELKEFTATSKQKNTIINALNIVLEHFHEILPSKVADQNSTKNPIQTGDTIREQNDEEQQKEQGQKKLGQLAIISNQDKLHSIRPKDSDKVSRNLSQYSKVNDENKSRNELRKP